MLEVVTLNSFQLIDLLFRFATVGILVLLVSSELTGHAENKLNRVMLFLCLISYLLLTVPVEDDVLAPVRPILLLFTNFLPYTLAALYWHKMYGVDMFKNMPKPLQVVLTLWLLTFAYFFLVLQGSGAFLKVIHSVGLLVLLFIVGNAVWGYKDDLVENRRDFRRLVIVLITLYATALTVLEVFFKWIKDDWLFSVVNAFLVFATTLYISHRLRVAGPTAPTMPNTTIANSSEKGCQKASLKDQQVLAKLSSFMQAEGFKENALTISKVADYIDVPEHHLRRVINQNLNYDNFSQFLNSYRIPYVCGKLDDADTAELPVLTLALDAGYNSIAPFNRAFKSLMKMTPTEYKARKTNQFQK